MNDDKRREDDYTLAHLRVELVAYTDRVAKMEHSLGVIEAAIAEIDRRVHDHIHAEDVADKHLHDCIHAVRGAIEEMKANLLLLTIKDAGHKTITFAEWLQKGAKLLSPILAFFLLLGGIVLWIIGKGPFPK